jgi:hypothetical protein
MLIQPKSTQATIRYIPISERKSSFLLSPKNLGTSAMPNPPCLPFIKGRTSAGFPPFVKGEQGLPASGGGIWGRSAEVWVLKRMPGFRIKCQALSPPGQEATVFAPRLPEDTGNPIPSTSNRALVRCAEGYSIEFPAPLERPRIGSFQKSQHDSVSFPSSFLTTRDLAVSRSAEKDPAGRLLKNAQIQGVRKK